MLEMEVRIVYPDAIVYELAVPETARYSVQWTVMGIQGVAGTGNWGATWNSAVNSEGATLESEHPLVGTGRFLAAHLPLTFRFRARLVVRIVPSRIIPFPTPDPTEATWEGIVTMSGCCLEGYLFRIGTTTMFPGYYRVSGEYAISRIQGSTREMTQTMVNVSNVRLSSGA